MTKEATNFIINQELMKIWTDNPLTSVALDAWGHAILTTLTKNFPEKINQERLHQYNPDMPAVMGSQPLAHIEFDRFFSDALWALGSDFVDGLVWTIDRQFDRHKIVRGSVRIMSSLESDHYVNLAIVYLKQ